MPDLSITVQGVKAVPFAASPLLAFTLAVRNVPAEQLVHSVVLRCQLQLDVTKRRYTADEERQLRDLFGEPERWSHTLRSMLWANTSVIVPPFTGDAQIDLQVPCTFDFNVSATKYFYGLAGGDVPLTFLFSGSVFYEDEGSPMQVAPISWNTEAAYRMPVSAWHDLMAHYYPNVAMMHVRRDVFDRLYRYKVERGIPTWEQVLNELLPAVPEEAPV